MAKYDISVNQGENFELQANLTDSNSSPINLSGYALRGKVKYSYGSTGVILDLNPQVVNATGGVISFSLTPYETSNLPTFLGVYDIEKYISGQSPELSVARILQGYFSTDPQVTT
jgi:hypothetical protein